MRFMLSAYSPNDPIYFGYKIKKKEFKDALFNGGAGYVLSNKALRLFAENILTNRVSCKQKSALEDWSMGW